LRDRPRDPPPAARRPRRHRRDAHLRRRDRGLRSSARGRCGVRPRADDRAVSPALPVPLPGERAKELAEEWVAAWNSHDLDAIMALYAPGIVFQTPTIIDTLGVPDGTVRGAEALREHFSRG